MRALEGEATDPGGNGLGLVSVQVDKVLCAAVELNSPSPVVGVYKGALGSIRELGQLRRCGYEAVVTDGCASEERGDGVRDAVRNNGGSGVGTRLVVVDADGDSVVSCSGSGGDARGESQDGGSEDGGELHCEGWVDCLMEEVGIGVSVVKK